jgi:hypothetical protein
MPERPNNPQNPSQTTQPGQNQNQNQRDRDTGRSQQDTGRQTGRDRPVDDADRSRRDEGDMRNPMREGQQQQQRQGSSGKSADERG